MFRAAQVADASPDVKLSGILNPVLWNRQRRRRLRSGNSTAGSGGRDFAVEAFNCCHGSDSD